MAFSRFLSVLARSRMAVNLCLAVMLSAAAGLAILAPAAAQSSDETELINLINALRANSGLAAYTVDPDLMALAREHSAYQASIHKSTHEHSDGRVPPQIGVVENVAGGDLGYITPDNAVYDIWAMDPGHLRTMVGFTSGAMGVGIADDGKTAYFTLDVRPMETTPTRPAGINALTPIPVTGLVTMTPRPDGTIIHEVGSGQTLWAIALAYGVQVSQIRVWNNLPANSTSIYVGQKLLVRPDSMATLYAPSTTSTAAPALTLSTTETLQPSSTAEGVVELAQGASQPTSRVEAAAAQNPPEKSNDLLLVLGAAIILLGLALLVVVLRSPFGRMLRN